jgi:putative DNA primase/helicase
MIISAEDDWPDTIRPRLEMLEADLARIVGVNTTLQQGDKEVYLSLDEHLQQLEEAIVENNITLVILDPILAFTGRRTDTYKSSEVGAVLAPLASMAARTGCAIVSILHLNKRSGEATSIYRLTASLDFTAAARSVLVVGRDPNDPNRRVLAPVKCDLSAEPKSLAFHFTSDGVLAWDGEVDLGAEDVLAPPVREETGARDDAKQFLKDALEEGAVPAKQILAEARECGIAEKTLRRAAKDLGVDIAHLGKPGEKGGGKWVWRMPQQDGRQDGQDILCEKGGHLDKSGHLDSPSDTKRGPGPSDSGHLANPQNQARWQDGHFPTHRGGGHLDGDAEVEL